MEKLTKKNPWKGLQSYQDTDIIYGREEETKALYTRILYNTQTVVYGKSGIGKSSIINAGIIPRAKHDEMLPVAIRLAHTTKKEQSETIPYVEQIFNRIKEEVLKVSGELEEIVPHVVDHKETMWELLHRYRIWNGKGEERKQLIPLLLFDQFEEIFTLEISNKRVESFFSELADLLNEVKPVYLTPIEENQIYENNSPQEDEKGKTRNVFSKIANRKRTPSHEYLDKSEFHIVITLREDFLAYLERYTAYIPIMKQNRFQILPLNEEQAAKIITEPIKGLVQKDVAEVIIQRVTGRNDFKLNGIPEIEVDAALLSLYMEQLYERKGNDNNIISSELVQFNNDIIKNFYENSIEGISEKTIEYIEDELITNANRRNNVARVDLISAGVSEDDLDKLIDKKVLRQFNYGGDLRIEFIHDILCSIVNDRIEHREQLAKEKEAKRIAEEAEARRKKEKEEEERRIAELEKSKKKQKYIYSVLVTISFFSILGIYFTSSMPSGLLENETLVYRICLKAEVFEDGDDEKKNFGPDDYWDVNLLFWTHDKSDTLRLSHPIDPAHCNFHKGGGADSLVLTITKAEIDSLKKIWVEIRPKTTLCKKDSFPIYLSDLNNNPFPVPISKNYEETDSYKGFVFTVLDNSKNQVPINEALVVVAGRTTYTNESGQYVINIPRGNTVFNRIYIIKQGYRFEETYLQDNNKVRLTRDTTINFKKRRDDILDLYEIASFDERKKPDTKPEDLKILKNFQIDIKNKKNLKRGGTKTDTLRYVCYRIKNNADKKNDADKTSIGEVRNIIGTYKTPKDIYIFEGFMISENPDSNQWLLEFTQYDSIFNTQKKKATLMHSNDNQRTKLLFNR